MILDKQASQLDVDLSGYHFLNAEMLIMWDIAGRGVSHKVVATE